MTGRPDLEMTAGWISRAIGVGFILLANVLAIRNLLIPAPWWYFPLNLLMLIGGALNFHLGTVRIRKARRHHEFMEEQRRRRPEATP